MCGSIILKNLYYFLLQVWSLFVDSERVAEMITTKIQEESLRTYLFTYSSVYDSLSLTTLSEMFELGIEVVHSIISKMIINEELMVCTCSLLHFICGTYFSAIWDTGLMEK